MIATAAAAAPPCSSPGSGWCVARRIEGEVAQGEIGFRFGEPLDADGDGRADLAAGTRFKLQGIDQTGTAAIWSGANGARLRAWDGEVAGGLFGHWVLPLPDLDGDALADVIIAAPNAVIDGTTRGVVSARSPKSGKEIWRRTGEAGENFGWDLAPAGDQDGDARPDLFAGAPAGERGRAYLLGGRDGSILRAYAPASDDAQFGWYVARLDDLDADGRPDLAVGSPAERDSSGVPVGAAYVFSSASGATLHRLRGNDAQGGFGEIVAAVGDLDGDGRGEIAVASPRTADLTRSKPGEVRVYSGAKRTEIRHWSGTQPGELFGRMVVSAGDLDGDGREELAISAPWHRRGADERVGRVEIRSGRSGEVLHEMLGDVADAWFGWHVRRAPDPDGLGRPALLIGSLRHPVGGQPGVGLLELCVLRPPEGGRLPNQGIITRGARRSDIR